MNLLFRFQRLPAHPLLLNFRPSTLKMKQISKVSTFQPINCRINILLQLSISVQESFATDKLPEILCVCVCVKSVVKEWALRALVQCPELSLERTSHQKSSFTSVNLAKMMSLNHNTIRPQDTSGFSLMEFRRSVREIVDCIKNLDEGEPTSNCPNGFQIIGWFKTSKVESESFLEVHEFHVVVIEPKVDPLPESGKQLKFPKPAPLV